MKLRQTVEEIDQKYHSRKVVVTDDSDKEIGITSLVEAHRNPGIRHRAFSLQLYRVVDQKKELLLQQRSASKPVFPLFWANTCCYNLAPGEQYITRAVSRVAEEMGVVVDGKELRELYKFSYYAPDLDGWCENELDNVIVGEWSGELKLNSEEAKDYKWIEWEELNLDIARNQEIYAPWFKLIVNDSRFQSVFE